jgi:hypothetical protein
MHRMILLLIIGMMLNSLEAASQLALRKTADTLPGRISIRILPQNFYSKSLGFFCTKEIQLQKLTALPLFIRLGTKDQVDYLERKPNARKID